MIIASIMTGTSADGVDIFVYDFNNKEKVAFHSYDFTNDEMKYIKSFLWPNDKKMSEISEFNFEFSRLVGGYFNRMPNEVLNKINYVVYHGQTVFHDPNMEFSSKPSTLQLGNGAVLANLINKNVICDLRSSDVSVGGQGAPLVPYGDKYFFHNENINRVILNVGGISNATLIAKDGSIKGFDLGVGNALLDSYVMKNFNVNFDRNSEIANKGKCDDNLLKQIIEKDTYLSQPFPKSTGKEKYNLEFINNLLDDNINKNNVANTLTSHIAQTIITLKNIINVNDWEIYIAGGGAYNPLLMSLLKDELPHLEKLDALNISVKEREAASFAVLGYYYLNDIKIGSTTGSTKETIAGALYKV